MPAAARKRATGASRGTEGQDDAADSPERRKLRNRISQRAFRARQAMRIQELEDRLEQASAPDMAWARGLQDQNARLREQLLQVHKKAMGMQISLRALADAAAQALGIDKPALPTIVSEESTPEPSASRPTDCTIDVGELQPPTQSTTTAEPFANQPLDFATPQSDTELAPLEPSIYQDLAATGEDFAWSVPNLDYFDGLGDNVQQRRQAMSMSDAHCLSDNITDLDFIPAAASHMSLVSLPSAQLGPEHYKDLTDRATAFSSQMQSVKRTNSRFSDHIDAFEACLASTWSQSGQMTMANKQSALTSLWQLISAIDFMISAFVNISCTRMPAWEACTRTLTAVKDLTAWRMDRSSANWQKIVPQYRPTKLQCSVAHPSVIDWIPWPSLRDRLIVHHSANPKLDEVISHVGKAYVVQADLSTLVRCPQPIIGYVPVWTLVQAITAGEMQDGGYHNDSRQPTSTGTSNMGMTCDASIIMQQTIASSTLPASSVNELFGSAILAKATHQLLGIGEGAASNYRLDPAFFEVYPELYDNEANIIAQGVRLRPSTQSLDQPYPIPGEMDAMVLTQYRDFSKIALECVVV